MDYTLMKHLESFQDIDVEYQKLYANWVLDQKKIGQALNGVSHIYPHYSNHDESHSLTIIRNIELLLGADRIKQLSPTDTWLLLMSAYLHDTGMIIVSNVMQDNWEKDDFQNFLEDISNAKYDGYDIEYIEAARYLKNVEDFKTKIDWPIRVREYVIILAAEYFRRQHAKKSKIAIEDLEDIFGLKIGGFNSVPKRFKDLTGQIAFLHNQPFEDVLKLDRKANGVGNDKIHPRFIATMIRLGDLLDLDDGRFSNVYQRMLLKMPKRSKIHKAKHASITHFLIEPKIIEVSANCDAPEIYRETKAWIDWLEDEIKNLALHWSEIVQDDFLGVAPRFGKKKLYLEGKDDYKEQANLRFEIKQEKAFEILEGSEIYEDSNTVFIRELIQNAMDATKIQIWKDVKSGIYDFLLKKIDNNKHSFGKEHIDYKEKLQFPIDLPNEIWRNYPIIISITEEEKDEYVYTTFLFKDYGCGISSEDLQRMVSIGESWSSDKKLVDFIEGMPCWLRPTGAFGLGLMSSFLVTNKIIMRTKYDDENLKEITFVSRKENGYVTVKDLEEDENSYRRNGTEAIIKIKKEKSTEEDLFVKEDVDKFEEYRNYIERMLGKKYSVIEENENSIQIKIDSMCMEYDQDLKWDNEDDKIRYAFVPEKNGDISMHILEKIRGSYLHINISQNSDTYYENLNYNFRGIRVCRERIRNIPIAVEWDLLNSETKKILNIARRKIKRHELKRLNDFLMKEILPRCLKKFIKSISKPENKNRFKGCYDYIFFKMKLICEILKIEHKSILDDLCNDLVLKIPILNKKTGKNFNMTVKELFDKKSFIYMNEDDYYELGYEYEKTANDVVEEIEKLTNRKDITNELIIDSLYFEKDSIDISKWVFDKFYIEYIYSLYGQEIFILRKIGKENNRPVTIKVDSDTYKKNILKLGEKYAQDTLYPFDKYKELIIKELPKDIVRWYSLKEYYIINPFIIKEDYAINEIDKAFKEMESKEIDETVILQKKNNLIDRLCNECITNKLVKWVLNHSALPKEEITSEEVIRKKYRELVAEFVDLKCEELIEKNQESK
ncbi:HD domain-containing protein [Crassaminicella profunda]|uniref:HD domain-containing protein n=1 Tax=Crassaminicella profunda TaxID=1286698 RepID=UPI001CA6E29B|nr:hypothetical protein [Crassaminicella profunda]QZY55756.1 hypothetical protein K7H06_01690 [Crassaminicella profunda]